MVSEAASKEQEDGTSFRNFHTACLPDRVFLKLHQKWKPLVFAITFSLLSPVKIFKRRFHWSPLTSYFCVRSWCIRKKFNFWMTAILKSAHSVQFPWVRRTLSSHSCALFDHGVRMGLKSSQLSSLLSYKWKWRPAVETHLVDNAHIFALSKWRLILFVYHYLATVQAAVADTIQVQNKN